MEKISGYELSRKWFDFCFENPEKISPNHSAIYFFAIEHCNRLGWKAKFGFPTQMAMDAIGIKKHQTYIRYFNDLVAWGFFNLIQKSKNQYSANIISIKSAVPKNGKALDKAIIKHAAKQVESNGQSNSSVNKPLTKDKPLTNKYREFLDKVYFEKSTELDEAFKDYLRLRIENKYTMTERAIKSLVKNLRELSGGEVKKALDMIDAAIVGKWKTFYTLDK
jgi:hypothetical protein